ICHSFWNKNWSSKVKHKSPIKKLRKILLRFFLAVLLLLVMGTLLLSLPIVQTGIAKYAMDSLNSEFGTNIHIERVQVSLLTLNTDIKGIYVEDYRQDTLAHIHKLRTSVLNLGNIAQGKLEFGDIGIDGLTFNLKTYQGEEDTNLDVFVAKLDDGKPRDPGTPPFYMRSSGIDIENGRSRLINENQERPTVLDFGKIGIRSHDFQTLAPEVSLGIEELSLEASRGPRLKKLAADFKY